MPKSKRSIGLRVVFQLLVPFIVVGFGGTALAKTCTWSAGAAGTFGTKGNWTCSSGSGPPGAADTAQFDNTSTQNCSITGTGAAVTALSINSGYTGTVTASATLTISGALTIGAGTLAASASAISAGSLSMTGGTFTGSTGTVTVTGNAAITGGTYTGGSGSATISGSVNVSDSVTNGGDPTLVGYWKLDETAGPAADSSGNATSLNWNGTPTATSAVPSAITFSDPEALSMTGSQYAGSSSALSALSVLRPATLTMSAWFKATSVDTNGAEIVSGSNTYGLRVTSSGLTIMKRITDNTSQADWIEYRVPETNHLDGNWHQIVGVIVTGSAGYMSAYLDSTLVAGSYWVNGSLGANLLSNSSSPTATTAAQDPIDWDANTETYGLIIGNNPSTTGYQFGGGTGCTTAGKCAIDDVRIYNRALTSAEIVSLSRGNQPGGGGGILSLAGQMTATGGVTIQSTGSLTLTSGSILAVGATGLTMDGTLTSTGGTIEGIASVSYPFHVGSTSSAAPGLDIDGLTVMNTDTNGMWINATQGAVTTFTEFDGLSFSKGTGTQLLQIYAPTLYLTSNGDTFDGTTTYAVTLTGNGTGAGAGPRAIFGDASCATNTNGICATNEKSDDDPNNDGIPSHPTTNGAVVQFVRGAESDTAGTLVGYPTAAFNWSTFTYYSTYVTFHDASNGSDVIYVRDESGNPLYSWTDPNAAETITGTPQWTTSSTGTHYLYVAVNGGSANSGKIYRLIDTGTGTTSGTLTVDTTWATSGAYSCTCTIASDISLDSTNVYGGATTATAQVLVGVKQQNGAVVASGWPVPTLGSVDVTASAPTLFTSSGTTNLYLGTQKSILRLAVTGTTFVQDTAPVNSITGRVSVGTSFLAATNGTSRVLVGDSSGVLWDISPSSFSGANFVWSYSAGTQITNNYYDAATDTVQFGTSGGTVVALNGAGSGTGGSLLNSSYPYTLNSSDPITSAPLYVNGVLAVASTEGKLYFLDRNTGTSPGVSIIVEYNFGPTETVSTIGYDANVNRYMVSTSSVTDDGRLYYIDQITDPTPSYQ